MAPNEDTKEAAKPLFRWIGGKQHLLRELLACCPPDVTTRRYFEPFLGAASLFLALRPKKSVLNDANRHLIQTYSSVRVDPDTVAVRLSEFADSDDEDTYYDIRDAYNRGRTSPTQAARFIYLNRTCFNGVFRVNMLGAFNVPYGFKEKPKFPARHDLALVADAFQGAKLLNKSYQDAVRIAGDGDFAYFDPPYPALNGTSYFAHYTMNRFADADQAELAKTVRSLDKKGCKVMVSNADTHRIRELYKGFQMKSVSVRRWVTCKKKKHVVRELVITNYHTPGQKIP